MNFQTSTSLESLKVLVEKFAKSGWIDNDGIANSLNSKLDNGDLNSFINEVQAQSGKHIAVDTVQYLLHDAQEMKQ